MDTNKMSDDELHEWLLDIRSRRKTGYTPRKKSKPKVCEVVLDSLVDLDEETAMKILDDLLKDDTVNTGDA